MQTSTPAFATAVVNQDQIIAYSVTITFPSSVPSAYGTFTDSVVTIDNDAQITTSTPEGTLLLAGYPSAQPDIVLSGLLNQPAGSPLNESQSVYWLFNPNDPTSPMFRQTRAGLPIIIQAGLYDGQSAPELITIFTGMIDTAVCSNGVVTLTCRDNRSTITNQASLPPVITFPPQNAGLTSQYAIDYLFRHASPAQYYSWPKQRANCVLSVGLRSSLWPEVGSYALFSQQPNFAQGVFGAALAKQPSLTAYTLAHPITPAQNNFVEAFVSSDGSSGNFEINFDDGTGTYLLIIEWDAAGHLFYFTQSPSGQSGISSISIPTVGKHYVALSAMWPSGSATITGTLRLDATSHAITITAADTRPSNINFTRMAIGSGGGTIEGVQATTEAAPVFNDTFSPTLLLDLSLNPLTALPDVSGQDAWGAFQDIASAENGIIGFNEKGLAFFKNRYTIDQTVAVRTVQSSKSLLTLDSSEQMSTVVTHVQIPVNQLQIQAATTVWSVSTILAIPGNGQLAFTVTTENPVVNVPLLDSGFFPNPPANDPGATYWRGCVAPDGNGAAVTTGIVVAVQQLSSSALAVTITNSNYFTVYLANPVSWLGVTGGPSLIIGGQPITALTTAIDGTVGTPSTLYADAQWPPTGSGGAMSNTQFGEILLQLPTNAWIQNLPTALQFADDLISDLHRPRQLFTNMQIVCDPRLQMADRLTVSDPDMSLANTDVLLVGIHTSLGAGKWTQMIDSRAFYIPGGWILGDAGFSELGSTTYLLEP